MRDKKVISIFVCFKNKQEAQKFLGGEELQHDGGIFRNNKNSNGSSTRVPVGSYVYPNGKSFTTTPKIKSKLIETQLICYGTWSTGSKFWTLLNGFMCIRYMFLCISWYAILKINNTVNCHFFGFLC